MRTYLTGRRGTSPRPRRRPLIRVVAALSLIMASAGTGAAQHGAAQHDAAQHDEQGTGAPPSLAFLARADQPVDALAAGAVAGRLGAPVLLAHPDALPEETRGALQSLDPDVVILAGGVLALDEAVAEQAAAALPDATVRRVAGPTRTHTAEALAGLIAEYGSAWLPVTAVDDFAPLHPEIAEVTRATAAYQDLDAAVEDGWDVVFQPDPDNPDSRCFDRPGVGGMGVHHVNPSLLDDQLDAAQPEALVYEVTPDGLQLVAVEYVVPADAWPDAQPPRVLDRDLHLNEALGLWTLHLWAWKDNPAGAFADHNPRVRLCPADLVLSDPDA